MTARKKFANSPLTTFLQRRILELRPIKSQAEIAFEAGFESPNMLSAIKTGSTALPIQRVAALAKALKTDPAHLFWLALEQVGDGSLARALKEIFVTIVTGNELVIIEFIRAMSVNTNPALTTRSRAALRAIFER